MDRLREPLPTRVEDTPELPPEYAAALEAGLDALALTLSPTARAAIDGHVRLLLAWTEAINLTGIREPAAVATAHVVDSLSGVGVLRERGIDRFIDLGSGGGYPGLPIAAALPAARALLLEPVAKKAGFLSAVASATGLGDDGRGGARPRRGIGRRPPPPRPLAGGDRPGRGRPRRARRACIPAARTGRRAHRLEARRHRCASWSPRNGRSMRSAAGRSRSVPSRSTASTATDWSSSPRAAGSRPGTHATPARASGGHGERHAARLEGVRIVVLSDIHSNLLALDAVLAKVGAVDAIWHLGDVVGYGPEPDGVVDRLTALGAIGVRGNHDAAATGGSEIDWFNPEAKAAMEWTRAAISEPTREWLAALPLRRIETDFTLVHGSPRDPIWEYVTSAALARAGLSAISTEHGLHGHTHIPIAFTMVDGRMRTLQPRAGNTVALGEGRCFLNPGSVGQPRDGDPRASCMVLDSVAGTATWERVPYDFEAVGASMRAAGLPVRLADRLRVGA